MQHDDKGMIGTGLVSEKPLRRDPNSGAYLLHPAYEGWRPQPQPDRSSWPLVLLAAVMVAVALWGLHYVR